MLCAQFAWGICAFLANIFITILLRPPVRYRIWCPLYGVLVHTTHFFGLASSLLTCWASGRVAVQYSHPCHIFWIIFGHNFRWIYYFLGNKSSSLASILAWNGLYRSSSFWFARVWVICFWKLIKIRSQTAGKELILNVFFAKYPNYLALKYHTHTYALMSCFCRGKKFWKVRLEKIVIL